jgi:ABC-type antimicrobial peptide transport system permease subunit
MFRLAWRQLQLDPLRTLITAFALGSVIAVVLILQGFEQGQYHQLESLVQNRKGDLIAAQAGVANFIAVRSTIPQLARGEVEAVEGVLSAHPITAIPVIYEKANRRTPVYVLVYDTKGGPASITHGDDIRDGRDIVIDGSLAKKYDINLGDTFVISDFEFNVSGFTSETAFMMPFAFISYDGMIDLYLESEIAPDLSTFPLLSYMLIELDPTADRDAVARRIESQIPSVDVFSSEKLAARDVSLGRSFFGPIMGLLVTVAYVIGLLVIALVMYADVRGRLRSFAVLKALGFPQSRLSRAVLLQALLLLAIALPVAVLLGQSLAAFIHSTAPLYLVRVFEPIVFGQTIAASLVFAILGALFPLHLVRRSDPMIAFEGT